MPANTNPSELQAVKARIKIEIAAAEVHGLLRAEIQRLEKEARPADLEEV